MRSCGIGFLPVLGIWHRFCWHIIFLTHTGQIRTLLYTRVPWIPSPRRCLQGDRRSCNLNEVMEDPVTKTQSHFYLLMCNMLMQAANLKWHKRVNGTKEYVDSQWNVYEVNGYQSFSKDLLQLAGIVLRWLRGNISDWADSKWSRVEDQ